MRSIICCLLFLPGFVQGQSPDWQVAVGGNSARFGRSSQVGPTAPNLLWSGGMSAVVSQQGACEGDRFYVARMFDINNTQQGTFILAYDLNTGSELWRKSLPVDFPSTDWRNMLTGVRNGVVYATRAGNTNASYLYALDGDTGNIIWKSADTCDQTTTESVSFASNGDIIMGNFGNVRRISSATGATLWTRPRSAPSSDGSNVAVFGERGYTWEASSGGPKVDVIDLTSGAILYKSPAIGGGFVQQLGLFVGPDGTVYAPRSQNNTTTDFLVAYLDTGSSLVEKWRFGMGYCPFASHAVGPDGSVYTYGQTPVPTIVRLDPATGSVMNSSAPIPSDFSQPRIAIDAAGRIFYTNGAFSNGSLISFNSDLSVRWSVSVPNVNLGGPVLGNNGTLIVCGTGSNIRAYRDPQDTNPSSFAIFRGIPDSGNLQSLFGSDDNRLVVRNGLVLNPTEPPIAVTIDGVSALANPTQFQLSVESKASTSGLTQEILAFNFVTQSYDLVDIRSAPISDQTVTINLPIDSRYIETGTRNVRARIQFRKTGPVQSTTYSASIDRSVWVIH